jgi:hypothetical protein
MVITVPQLQGITWSDEWLISSGTLLSTLKSIGMWQCVVMFWSNFLPLSSLPLRTKLHGVTSETIVALIPPWEPQIVHTTLYHRLIYAFKRLNRYSALFYIQTFDAENSLSVGKSSRFVCWIGKSMGLVRSSPPPPFLSLSLSSVPQREV